jgi:hypothetical protein
MMLAAHFLSEQRLPGTLYATIMLLRGLLPLLVRAAEVGPALTSPLAYMKLLSLHPGWDVLHAVLVVACVAHNKAVQRRRAARAAADKVWCVVKCV